MATCKNCGGSIEWIECDGQKIPIDPKQPTYEFIGTTWRKSGASVSHLFICPARYRKADEPTERPAFVPPKHWAEID